MDVRTRRRRSRLQLHRVPRLYLARKELDVVVAYCVYAGFVHPSLASPAATPATLAPTPTSATMAMMNTKYKVNSCPICSISLETFEGPKFLFCYDVCLFDLGFGTFELIHALCHMFLKILLKFT